MEQQLRYIAKYFKLKQFLSMIFMVIISCILSHNATVVREGGSYDFGTKTYVYEQTLVVALTQGEQVTDMEVILPYVIKLIVTSAIVFLVCVCLMFLWYNLLAKGCFEGVMAPLKLSEEESATLYQDIYDPDNLMYKCYLKKDNALFTCMLVISLVLVVGTQLHSYGQVVEENLQAVKKLSREVQFDLLGVEEQIIEETEYYTYTMNRQELTNLARIQGMVTYPEHAVIADMTFTEVEATPEYIIYGLETINGIGTQ